MIMQASNKATTIITVLSGIHYAKEIEARSYQKWKTDYFDFYFVIVAWGDNLYTIYFPESNLSVYTQTNEMHFIIFIWKTIFLDGVSLIIALKNILNG